METRISIYWERIWNELIHLKKESDIGREWRLGYGDDA